MIWVRILHMASQSSTPTATDPSDARTWSAELTVALRFFEEQRKAEAKLADAEGDVRSAVRLLSPEDFAVYAEITEARRAEAEA